MKSFILGLGAQKCGTTWLHRYLSGLDGVDFGFLKEYQTLNPRSPVGKVRQTARALATLAAAGVSGRSASPEARRARFLLNRQTYYGYFACLLEQPGTTATGDITPAYSALRAPELREVAHQFEKLGITVRPVFLMRDPVDRCLSAVRMRRRNFERGKSSETVTARHMAMNEEQHLLDVYRSEQFTTRSRYDRTVAEIEEAFPSDAVAYAFFEELFSEDTVRRLCDQLGLNYKAPRFEQTVKTTKGNSQLSDAASAEIARHLAPVYAFAARRYGEDFIARIWPSYRFVA